MDGKAYESSLTGATVELSRSRPEQTLWWHDYAVKGEVRFLRGRLKFGALQTAHRSQTLWLCSTRVCRTG